MFSTDLNSVVTDSEADIESVVFPSPPITKT